MLVYVPAGMYPQGSGVPDAPVNERPPHQVSLPGFWIGRVPVTNEQYARFLDEQRHATPKGWPAVVGDVASLPVVGVTFADALAYCSWAGLELPWEAQWEAAARGAEGLPYPWGHDAPTPVRCNLKGSPGKLTGVGQYPLGAGPFGTLDQAGNVREWCRDAFEFEAYASRTTSSFTRPMADPLVRRVVRGGSFRDTAESQRATWRVGDAPSHKSGRLGFRCARST